MEGEKIGLDNEQTNNCWSHQSKHKVQKVLIHVVIEIRPRSMIQTSTVERVPITKARGKKDGGSLMHCGSDEAVKARQRPNKVSSRLL